MKYDIFISYRRDNGEQSAKAIYDKLRERGYKVFLDVETLRSGAFNQKLYSVIEECQDVLVILSPNALERCAHEDDWVRLEIAHALKCRKNVIPIMLRGFVFPNSLPQDIEPLRYQNGLQASVEFFDAFLDKLYSFLKSRPGIARRFFNSLSWRRSAAAVIACLLLISGIWGGSVLYNQRVLDKSAYPASQKQVNDVKNMLYYMQMNLTVLDNMYFAYQNLLKDCEDHLQNPSSSSFQNVVSRVKYTKDTIKKHSQQVVQLTNEMSSALSGTNINIADLTALSKIPDTLLMQYGDSMNFLEYAVNPGTPFDAASRRRIIAVNNELLQLEAQSIFVGVCELLLPVDESALKSFRTEFLPSLRVISKGLPMWSRDETSLKSQDKSIASQMQNLMMEYSVLAGEKSKELMSEKDALLSMLTRSGMTKEEAQSYIDKMLANSQKVASLDEKKKEVEDLQKTLENERQLLREKTAPKEGDDPYLVWGKALRFLTVKMYDDAISALQFYFNQVRNTDKDATVYVPAAINFIRNINSTGIDYGVLVAAYEPGKPYHSVYKIGDIIVALNKTPCKNANDFKKIREGIPQDSSYKASVLRPDDRGILKIIDVEVPGGQPKIALMNLKESE